MNRIKLVILAGGKGKRLGLQDIPKPMVDLNGKPLIQHQIELAARYGITDIFLLTGHLAEVIFKHFGDGSKFGVRITYFQEPYPLGTAGSLAMLKHMIAPEEKFLVIYGDLALEFDINKFLEFDNLHPESIGTLFVHPNSHPQDSDLVECDEDGKIHAFLTKPHDPNLLFQNLANAAVYLLKGRVFDSIPFDEPLDLAKDIFPRLIDQPGGLFAYKSPEYLHDIGTLERLEEVRSEFQRKKPAAMSLAKKKKAIFLDRDGVINKNFDKTTAENFDLLPGVSEAIKKIDQSEFLCIVVTNQPAIAKGWITLEQLRQAHKKMETELGKAGAYLDDIFFCPHHPEKGFDGEIHELKIDCDCRKPKPGMLLKAADRFNIDLSSSWMVGDSERDIEAGRTAGCHTIFISEEEASNLGQSSQDLLSAVDLILEGAPH